MIKQKTRNSYLYIYIHVCKYLTALGENVVISTQYRKGTGDQEMCMVNVFIHHYSAAW